MNFKQVYSRDGIWLARVYKHMIVIYKQDNPFKLMYENSHKFGEVIHAVYLDSVEIHNMRKFAADYWPINNVKNIR